MLVICVLLVFASLTDSLIAPQSVWVRNHTPARVERLTCDNIGQHLGAPQTANLGDGNGAVDQVTELRQDYGIAAFGSCLESLIGGNHFRYVLQRVGNDIHVERFVFPATGVRTALWRTVGPCFSRE
jgi:hypothetical protein